MGIGPKGAGVPAGRAVGLRPETHGLGLSAFIPLPTAPHPQAGARHPRARALAHQRSPQLLSQPLRFDVRVTLEHGQALVSGHARHFHDAQALLKEP